MESLNNINQENNQNMKQQNQETEKKENWRSYPEFLLTKEEKRILKKEKRQMVILEIFLFLINLPLLVVVLPVFSLGFFFEKGFEVTYLTFKAFIFRVLFFLNILFIIAGLMLLAIINN